MGWIQDLIRPKARLWEDIYRNRWQHDKRVRSTHGVNCTGGCSWWVYVKDGIIVWELQATDYPYLEGGIPHYEPRGCQRGITFSWYVYSPLRVKYPYIRGVLADAWRKAKTLHSDPVEAWASVVGDDETRGLYQRARGKGGLRRTTWDEAVEIIAAAAIYTAKRYGPDRIIGFSPIPAMSMLSYSAGTRFLSLLGGVTLSFYDWYADFPPASPEVWGEKTDVGESADWYNSKYIVVMGSNLNMTRTPDAHFAIEARHYGAKLVVLSPDFSQVSKHADWWLPVAPGQDGAFWMAVCHVIQKEFHSEKQVPYFTDYLKRYSDSPFLVLLEPAGPEASAEIYKTGKFLHASQIERYGNVENGDWKPLIFDSISGMPRMPRGSIGFRWQRTQGLWNLEMKDGLDGASLEPVLSFIEAADDILPVAFRDHAAGMELVRDVPVKYADTKEGRKPVTTVFDLMMGQFGVARELKTVKEMVPTPRLAGNYPEDYDDPFMPYTPAWQEKFTGIKGDTVVRFAREWAETARLTGGRCTIIVGSGTNHWYHSNLMYRAGITALILCGCVGVNGGGLNHYTGQEKVAPNASWASIAFALDWMKPPRQQNAPSFHYVHSDQWRYDRGTGESILGNVHPMEMQADSVRMGWLPFYPQFNKNPLELAHEAFSRAGAKTDAEITSWLVDQLKNGKIHFAVEDADAPENWPRLWFIWRGNALHTSAKGNEYFLRHYLGADSNAISDEIEKKGIDGVGSGDIVWREPAPRGKMDLVVDLNFRMDTSALYSDIVLPSATWYEKNDLNTTDLHSYIHPLSAAVPPCWQSKDDWEIFAAIAKKVGELSPPHFPNPFRDVVTTALAHDTPGEIAQPSVKNWHKNQCEPVPGLTMPNFSIVERDYVNIYDHFVSYGHAHKKNGMTEHGISWEVADLYDDYLKNAPYREFGGERYIAMEEMKQAANVLLFFAPESNGEVAWRGFAAEEEHTGVRLTDLAKAGRNTRYNFDDLLAQPRRVLTSPAWSGITNGGRAYSAYCINVEHLLPWRTLTGRQHFYLDHEGYLDYGESLPSFKLKADIASYRDFEKSRHEGDRGPHGEKMKTIVLSYLTPHGKWHIHSTYYDNLLMLTLSRGAEPFWLNLEDAAGIGVRDNDWVEIFNDNGVIVTRAAVSIRIPKGVGIFYHAPERTIYFAKSPLRKMRRGGGTNALTRIRLKPVLMVGGYAQLSFAFNAWGPPSPDRDSYCLVRKLPGKPVF